MAIGLAYSAYIVDNGITLIMLRPQVADICTDHSGRPQLLEADFLRLARSRDIALDFRGVVALTPNGLRALRMFKRDVEVHGGRLVLRNIREELRSALGTYFRIEGSV